MNERKISYYRPIQALDAVEDILPVSSSLRYDLMWVDDLGIRNKVLVSRGHEPCTPYYNYHAIKDLNGLPAIVGL